MLGVSQGLRVVEGRVASKVGLGLGKLVEVVGVAGEAVEAVVVPVEEVGVVLVVVLVVVHVGVEVVALGHVVILLGLLVVLLGLDVGDRRGDGLRRPGLVVVGLHVVVEPVGLRGLSVDLELAEGAGAAEGREGVLGFGLGLGIGVGGHRDGENHKLWRQVILAKDPMSHSL